MSPPIFLTSLRLWLQDSNHECFSRVIVSLGVGHDSVGTGSVGIYNATGFLVEVSDAEHSWIAQSR